MSALTQADISGDSPANDGAVTTMEKVVPFGRLIARFAGIAFIMAITAGAAYPTQRYTDGGIRVTRLNAQVQVNHGAATFTVDNQPVMF